LCVAAAHKSRAINGSFWRCQIQSAGRSQKALFAKKRRILDLSARIDKLPKKIGTTDFSETLHALRIIGNLGTHGDRVLQSAMLDAFQLYEMALGKLFEDKSQNAKAIIKRLKAHKA
jgi:hypothetical protein